MFWWTTAALASNICVPNSFTLAGGESCNNVYANLGLASNNLVSGDVVWVNPTVELSEPMMVPSGITVTVRGLDAANRANFVGPMGVVDGAFLVDGGDLTLEYVQIRSEEGGRGIRMPSGTLTLRHVSFLEDAPGEPNPMAAVSIAGGTATIEDSTFAPRSSTANAAHISASATALTVRRSTFDGGLLDNNQGGAAIHFVGASSTLVIEDSIFTGNTVQSAGEGGGAIYIRDALSADIIDSQFVGNSSEASRGGGAIYVHNDGVTIQNCVFEGNSSTLTGGAIRMNQGGHVTTITGSTFDSNVAADRGGALDNVAGSLTTSGNLLRANETQSAGGAVGNLAVWDSTDDTFCRNRATQGGGAIVQSGGSAAMVLTRPVFARNVAATTGGGVRVVTGDVTFDHATFVANQSNGSSDALILLTGGGDTVEIRGSAFLHHPGTAIAPAPGTWEYNAYLGNDEDWAPGSEPTQIGEVTTGDPWVSPTPACDRAAVAPASPQSALLEADGSQGTIGALPFAGGTDSDGDGWFGAVDCGPADAALFPGAPVLDPDAADGFDDDCDGYDECFEDFDGDGFGGPPVPDLEGDGCGVPPETVTGGDCDDKVAEIRPGAPLSADDVNDQIDADCDGVDECFEDDDGDGQGSPNIVQGDGAGCITPGLSIFDADCDDDNAEVFLGHLETCNGIDDDCDGDVDDDDADVVLTTWFEDLDGDGYGNDGVTLSQCEVPTGFVTEPGDCDEEDPAINPVAPEACVDGIDNDCDLLVDGDDPDFVEDPVTFYFDSDGDGYGDPLDEVSACGGDEPEGYVPASLGDDCDDSDPDVSPVATEACNGFDDDCDGAIDEGFTLFETYIDDDGDGYGDPDTALSECVPDPDRTQVAGDCDDTDALVNPEGVDTCTADQNCDGFVDPDEMCEGEDGGVPVTGCRCSAPGHAGSMWFAILLLAAVRGSRRPPASRSSSLP